MRADRVRDPGEPPAPDGGGVAAARHAARSAQHGADGDRPRRDEPLRNKRAVPDTERAGPEKMGPRVRDRAAVEEAWDLAGQEWRRQHAAHMERAGCRHVPGARGDCSDGGAGDDPHRAGASAAGCCAGADAAPSVQEIDRRAVLLALWVKAMQRYDSYSKQVASPSDRSDFLQVLVKCIERLGMGVADSGGSGASSVCDAEGHPVCWAAASIEDLLKCRGQCALLAECALLVEGVKHESPLPTGYECVMHVGCEWRDYMRTSMLTRGSGCYSEGVRTKFLVFPRSHSASIVGDLAATWAFWRSVGIVHCSMRPDWVQGAGCDGCVVAMPMSQYRNVRAWTLLAQSTSAMVCTDMQWSRTLVALLEEESCTTLAMTMCMAALATMLMRRRPLFKRHRSLYAKLVAVHSHAVGVAAWTRDMKWDRFSQGQLWQCKASIAVIGAQQLATSVDVAMQLSAAMVALWSSGESNVQSTPGSRVTFDGLEDRLDQIIRPEHWHSTRQSTVALVRDRLHEPRLVPKTWNLPADEVCDMLLRVCTMRAQTVCPLVFLYHLQRDRMCLCRLVSRCVRIHQGLLVSPRYDLALFSGHSPDARNALECENFNYGESAL